MNPITFFSLSINSYYGVNADIIIKDGMIYYRNYPMPVDKEFTAWSKKMKIEPATLDTIMAIVKNWEKQYITWVCDGTSWEINIETDRKKIKFHGHEQFPDGWRQLITHLGEMCDEDLSDLASR